jgi:hypothetical protein
LILIAVVVVPLAVAVVRVTLVAVTTAEKVSGIPNHNHNKSLADTGAIINNQTSDNWKNWEFGWNTINKNGCALITVYNVVILGENPQRMADIVRFRELTGGQLMFGLFDTAPSHVPQY